MGAKQLSNELRNGNWINYIGKPIKVNIETIYAVSKCVGETAMYQPIQLTEEWLVKLGFEWSIFHQAYHLNGFDYVIDFY